MIKLRTILLTSAALAASGVATGSALAQNTAAAPGDTFSAGLNEIIVTAQKREQKLQDVPVSIAAIGGKDIENLQISDLRSIQGYVPNLAILNSGVNPVVYIRGFGSGPNNVAFDQEVSVYLDGIYGGRGAQYSAPFFDLERMEVLRGPQGALFGRNTAAGAISLVSAKPGKTFEAQATGGYDFAREGFGLDGVVSGPVSDKLGLRFAGKMTHENGYIRNLFDNEKDPQVRDELARLTAVLAASDNVDVTAKLEYGRHLLKGGAIVTGDLNTRTDFDQAGSVRYVSDNYAGSGLPEQSGIKSWNGVVTTNITAGEHTITAIGGYSKFDTRRFTAYDERAPDGTIPTGNGDAKFGNAFPENFEQWSGELRLASPTGKLFDYVVGAYFDHHDYHLHQDSYYREIAGTITGHQRTDFYQNGDAYSFYGQGTVNFTSTLRAIGGIRYSNVKKSGTFTSGNVSGTPLNAIGADQSANLNEHYWDPSATLQADVTKGVMLYASFGRGSKSGGFVSNTYGVTAAGFTFRPERSKNIEAGMKSNFLNNRVAFNVSIFQTDFKDLQQSAYDPDRRTFFTRNAAKARSKGVETELQVAATDNLTLNASVAYLDAKFLDYPGAPCLAYETLAQCNSADPVSIAAHNIKGLPLQFAPKWSGNVGFRHRADMGSYRLTTGLTALFRSSYFIADGYSPIWGMQGGWVKLDGRIEFGPSDEKWALALIGRNITDKHTAGSTIRFPASITAVTRSLSVMDEYRSVKLQATARF